jgi:peptide-methionine (S)-S-oxide reductase
MSKAMFGAGCFWGVEEKFRVLKRVKKTEVGYAGGDVENATYKQVCSGKTGHAEVVLIEFDSKKISFGELLEKFWEIHNPTTRNRQGWDIGSQYRSVIFYFNEKQKKEAEESLKKQEKKIGKKIVTEIVKVGLYCKAEGYHQKYVLKSGKNVC